MSNRALFIIALILVLGFFAFMLVQDNTANSDDAYEQNINRTTSINNDTKKS